MSQRNQNPTMRLARSDGVAATKSTNNNKETFIVILLSQPDSHPSRAAKSTNNSNSQNTKSLTNYAAAQGRSQILATATMSSFNVAAEASSHASCHVEYDASSSHKKGKDAQRTTAYGAPNFVSCSGSFPQVGSTLGPFFCLGQLGKGTFSSIHKSIDMATLSVAAAKVELETFKQSGVLDSEATLLAFLHQNTPPGTVPKYYGYYKATAAPAAPSVTKSLAFGGIMSSQQSQQPPQQFAALFMEYLSGQDMHQLRDALPSNSTTRRMTIDNAVYLVASVLLPLLKEIHAVGLVHRDIKPSNCVRASSNGDLDAEQKFCMVDFGLSKSIVVHKDSPLADSKHPWPKGRPWLNPDESSPAYDTTLSSSIPAPACVRQARDRAEFRGTSMYASLRVHQLQDYSFRDDIWSLAYVFCDLVSGGLPWMSHAAHRDRDACQQIKELVHGPDGAIGCDMTELLLMGDEYHVAKFKRDQQLARAGNDEQKSNIALPEPLALYKDEKRVGLLREIFVHLASLGFGDMPDYALVERCIRKFADDDPIKRSLPTVSAVRWVNDPTESPNWKRRRFHSMLGTDKTSPQWNLVEESSVDAIMFKDIDESDIDKKSGRLAMLPLEFRFRLKQMEYHASRPHSVPPHVVLRDWMNVVLPLIYGEWNSAKYETGNRTSTDGMKRDTYLELLRRCEQWLKRFGGFRDPACYLILDDDLVRPESQDTAATDSSSSAPKRRKVETERGANNMFVNVSRAIRGLACKKADEMRKRSAPGMRTSFGL